MAAREVPMHGFHLELFILPLKKVKALVAQLCLTLCAPMNYIADQAPLTMEFSRQEYWSG